MEKPRFNFEDLEVWKKGIVFAKEAIILAGNLSSESKHFRLIDQIEAAATSVPSNIAEGAGRFSRKEFINFLYIARGSLYEVLTLLTICRQDSWIKNLDFEKMRAMAAEINRMISGLIASLKP